MERTAVCIVCKRDEESIQVNLQNASLDLIMTKYLLLENRTPLLKHGYNLCIFRGRDRAVSSEILSVARVPCEKGALASCIKHYRDKPVKSYV